jgi:hypothetical protein
MRNRVIAVIIITFMLATASISCSRHFAESKPQQVAVKNKPIPTPTKSAPGKSYGNFTEYAVDISPDSIREFSLRGYAPNPFGPSNDFTYALPIQCSVKFSVWDIVGNPIDSTNLGIKKPGVYRVLWNPADVRSGVYFVIIHACDYEDTTKFILLR